MKRLFSVTSLLLLAACAADATGGATGGAGGGTGGTDPVTVPCSDCLAATIAWGPVGGFVQYDEASSLGPCRRYTHTRTIASPSLQQTMPPKSCAEDLPGCDAGAPGIHDVEQALAHPDVVAALGATVPLYGGDPRPCDGSVMSVTIGGETVLVGADCGDTSFWCTGSTKDCVPVPAGLRALVDVLQAVDQEELALPECAQALQ